MFGIWKLEYLLAVRYLRCVWHAISGRWKDGDNCISKTTDRDGDGRNMSVRS